MRFYAVLETPGHTPRERFVLLREGFCWPAFWAGPLWLVAHRLWPELGLYLLAGAIPVAASAGVFVAPGALALFFFGLQLVLALEAGALRVRALRGRGFGPPVIVAARSRGEAEARYAQARRAEAAPEPPGEGPLRLPAG